ncbi:centrosomal protein of 72 kDa [Tenrec ecaudatus]|uniref:centrosomal protein of 72 kDa n=1 Tax=Tenrec ecaudatus TaxID=94439 RepID=UPI003F5A14C7
MAPPGLRLVLTEDRVREKSGLAAHQELAELRSLSVPGTYQEKITNLGNSLMNLTGLKSLDLSRNSLISLEGIQYLTVLERLNLYYNCISSLAEVFRLHALLELTDVDFRLNPVVKNESDYRLFVVHMLPHLRQLDDRPVRESERKASRLHFTSEESLDSKPMFPAALKGGRPRHCRAKGADPLSKCQVLDADDEAVLNLIAECEWDLSNPPGSTSSSQRERETDFPSSQESRGAPSPPSSSLHQSGDSAAQKGPDRRKRSSRGGLSEKPLHNHCCGEQSDTQPAYLPHFLFPPQPDSTDLESSLRSSQQSSGPTLMAAQPSPGPQRYRKHRGPGGRFPGPLDQECPGCLAGVCGLPSSEESLARPCSSESPSEKTCLPPEEPKTQEPPHSASVARERMAGPPGRTSTLEAALLETLLDLVDRHWGGRRSLHSNEAFLAQVRHILSSVQALTAAQDQAVLASEAVGHLTQENESLQQHLEEQQQQHSAALGEAHQELEAARRETEDLQQHLDRSLEENSTLKSLLFSLKKEAKSADMASTLNVQITGLQSSVKRLSGEIAELKQHLEHYDKIQELTQMLQESHSSLVSTNEHLLQEMGHMRTQHRAEVEQLHWSYQELKKTMALFPARSPGPGGC